MFIGFFIGFAAFAPVALGSHLLVAAAGGLPRIDIEKSCREASEALHVGTTASVFDSCMEDEKAAAAKLAKDRATFPAVDKAHSGHAAIYLPSYVQGLTRPEGERTL